MPKVTEVLNLLWPCPWNMLFQYNLTFQMEKVTSSLILTQWIPPWLSEVNAQWAVSRLMATGAELWKLVLVQRENICVERMEHPTTSLQSPCYWENILCQQYQVSNATPEQKFINSWLCFYIENKLNCSESSWNATRNITKQFFCKRSILKLMS